MAWTEMQKQAIYTRGQNILVSAGAGSGKTAVLSERILEYCLDGQDIRRFLVLTFTNAAASEMKERIRKKLMEHQLFNQANLIDSAFITTFDAFSLALVKKYYYLLHLEKDVKIMDSALLEVRKKEIMDEIFEEHYKSQNEEFLNFLTKYTKQNDENVKKIILSIFEKLELVVDEKNFCDTYEEHYLSSNFLKTLTKAYESIALENVKKLEGELKKLMDYATSDSASTKLYEEVEQILKDLKYSSYDEAVLSLNQMSLPRIHPKALDFVKEQKTVCSNLLKEIKTTYFSKYLFLADAEQELYSIKGDVLFLLQLALEVKNRLDEYKIELMSFGYMDIAKLAIRLVEEHASVQKELQNHFVEILIDEYQDTSDIQETFIQKISNHNCYMVGDIKQSIYRFRNANPYIFKNKYENYSNLKDGKKIDLTFNFRSRAEVIADINSIFTRLMTNSFGDADYAKEHMMRYGQKGYETLSQNQSFQMEILSYDLEDSYTEEEMEAFICGKKIKELMEQKVKILKGKEFVPLTYSDIAIIIDKTKSFTTLKRVFEYLGIPLSIEADLDLATSMLPKLISNILTLISLHKKEKEDKSYVHALASVGRSFLFAYDDSIIYKLVHGRMENELTNKIEELSVQARDISLEELYFLILEEFQIYEKLPVIGEVNTSCITLEYMYSLFQTMAQARMGLDEGCTYLSAIFEKGISLKFRANEDSQNSVHLMTIHKSKGLEFAYCFFPMLGGKFNQQDMKDNFGLSKSYGVYIPFSDETNSNTIIKTLVQEELRQADLSEKIRLFYVALTRAREKIILISKEQDKIIPLDKANSFNDILTGLSFLKEERIKVLPETLNLSKNYLLTKTKMKQMKGKKIEYVNTSFLSDIRNSQRISKEMVELTSPNLLSALELGKKFHECLEVLDLSNPDIEALPVDEMMKQSIRKVLSTDLFKNIASAKTYHEHEFYFENYHGIIDLFCVYEDHIDLIDYKLANTEHEEYVKQLEIYKMYVSSISNLPVSCYLLSILKQEIKKVL